MRILISGSTGLVGEGLVKALRERGDEAVRLTRPSTNGGVYDGIQERHVAWNVVKQSIDGVALLQNGPYDAVVHLGGEAIAGKRWTNAQREKIHDSRVDGTRLLAEAMVSLPERLRPNVMVSMSAIGYYGIRGDEALDETSLSGVGFLSQVSVAWEAAADMARIKGIRLVHPRLGVVVSPKGGALAKLLPIFKRGLGGVAGSGNQYWSWISLEDTVRGILFCIDNEGMEGPVNLVAPQPVTNREFTKTLGRVLARPTIFPAPAFMLRLVFGEMADAMVLGSIRVFPRKLEEAGYAFKRPELEAAIRSEMGMTDDRHDA